MFLVKKISTDYRKKYLFIKILMLHFHFQLANRATRSLWHKGLQPEKDSLAPENAILGLVDRVFAKISFLQKMDIIPTFTKKIFKNRGVEIGGFCLLEIFRYLFYYSVKQCTHCLIVACTHDIVDAGYFCCFRSECHQVIA